MQQYKEQAAQTALGYLQGDGLILGIGSGSTANCFIDLLPRIKGRIEACVASSLESEKRLRALGIPVVDLNYTSEIPYYIDGADEVNPHSEMIKGKGGALVREKVIATVSSQFLCIVDASKLVKNLGQDSVAVEVIPIARSAVARELVRLGGNPQYREGFLSDNGNIILDVFGLEILVAATLEETIKLIPGVVDSGIFAKRKADTLIVAGPEGVRIS